MKHVWLIPTAASIAFLLFTVWVVMTEGPLGFLAEHSRNAWGAQIGIDLFNSLMVALVLAVPIARRQRVRAWPWVVLTCATGSIGIFAFMARIAYVRYAHEGSPSPSVSRAATEGV
jgi:hypothetical protein